MSTDTKIGGWDLQNALSNINIRFPFQRYPGEMHVRPGDFRFLGPGTHLRKRLDENDNPLPDSIPLNSVDYESYKHDLAYRDADTTSNPLQAKLSADRKMLDALEKIAPQSVTERFGKFVAQQALRLKLRLGIGIEEKEKPLNDTQLNENKQIAQELHHPLKLKNANRRHLYSNYKGEIFSMDIIEIYPEKGYKYALTIMDLFTRKAWIFVIKTKSSKDIIASLELLFKEMIPKKIFSDKDSAFYSKACLKFIKENNVELYSTQSELKAFPIERFNRSIKMIVERMKTESELDGKEFKSLESIKNALTEYNNRIHKGLGKLTPNQAFYEDHTEHIKKIELRKKLRKIYNDKGQRFSLGEFVRIYKYKPGFTKGYKETFTKEVFKIVKINDTHPATYVLSDKDNNIIKGNFYDFEIIKTFKSGFD